MISILRKSTLKNMQYGVQNLPNLDIVHGLILDKWLVLLVIYAKAD